jgi:outer membrane protein assembly factor BamA
MPGMSRLRRLALLIALLAPWPALADWPRVVEIAFEGNAVTRESVLLREMALAVGDPASPEAIERSRQAILDLGLFREVHVSSEPAGEGVRLRVRLREKRYFLPVPRIDASSDRDYSFGAQLNWSNVWGLNHRLSAFIEEGRFPDDPERERERTWRVSYNAPYLFANGDNLSLLAERRQQVTTEGDVAFDETFRRLQLLRSRDFRTDRPRRGWIVGLGAYYQNQSTAGEFAPPRDGAAIAGLARAEYRDLRFNVFSETGTHFEARGEGAVQGLLSDYGYGRLTLDYARYYAIGDRPHQSLHLLGQGGAVFKGPRSRDNFGLGGSSRLRGYDSDYLEGDAFYYGAVEYLRPLGRDWLRLLAAFEIGGTGRDIGGLYDGKPHASLALGVRMRLGWFVNTEIELGVALPLRDGDGLRFFAGANSG